MTTTEHILLYLPFEIGDIVYLKTDPDQKKRIIIGVLIRQNSIEYDLSMGNIASWHYDFEISKNIDLVQKTSD